MSNIQTFPMPDVGEGLTEAEVLTWHVAVGDSLIVNQIMVEIETAKAAVELPSPYAGVVTALLVEPGVTVEVGTPIISIDTDAPAELGASTGPSTNGSPVPGVADPAAAIADATIAENAVAQGGAKIGEMTADGRIATLVGYVSARPPGKRGARRSSGAPAAAAPVAGAPAAPADQTAPAPAAPAQA